MTEPGSRPRGQGLPAEPARGARQRRPGRGPGRATPAAIRALVAEAGADLRTRPEPGEWSVLECIGHIADGELVVAGRYAGSWPTTSPRSSATTRRCGSTRLHHESTTSEALLALFEALRAVQPGPLGTHSRRRIERGSAIHRERGEESFDLMFRLLGGHDRVHLGAGAPGARGGPREPIPAPRPRRAAPDAGRSAP